MCASSSDQVSILLGRAHMDRVSAIYIDSLNLVLVLWSVKQQGNRNPPTGGFVHVLFLNTIQILEGFRLHPTKTRSLCAPTTRFACSVHALTYLLLLQFTSGLVKNATNMTHLSTSALTSLLSIQTWRATSTTNEFLGTDISHNKVRWFVHTIVNGARARWFVIVNTPSISPYHAPKQLPEDVHVPT